MASHSFERFCSLWLTRVRGCFVIENLPIRVVREKVSKFSPGKGSNDIDLISFDPQEPDTLYLNECKSHIHSTFAKEDGERLVKQLSELERLAKLLPFGHRFSQFKLRVFGIRIAGANKSKIRSEVEVIDGKQFEEQVLKELLDFIGLDPWIDPKDDVMGSLRLLWHFGCLREEFYERRARAIIKTHPSLSPAELRDELGLISYKTEFCRTLLDKIKHTEVPPHGQPTSV